MKCPECRAPLERRAEQLCCTDHRNCRARPSPLEVIMRCPDCGADAWIEKGTKRGTWVRINRRQHEFRGTVAVRCGAGHRERVPVPEDMRPRVNDKQRSRRGF